MSAREKSWPPRARQFLEVALSLFSGKDFARVTIKDIADACHVNTGLIYYYFDNKEHLFHAALEHGVTQAIERYEGLRDENSDPVYLIKQWFDNNVKLAAQIKSLVKIMLDYSQLTGEVDQVPISDVVTNFYSTEEKILADSIRKGIDSGTFRKVDADNTAHFLSVHLDGIVVAALIRSRPNIEDDIRLLEDFLWRHLGVRRA